MNKKIIIIFTVLLIVVLIGGFFIIKHFKDKEENNITEEYIPVSYTHLDVYKRQELTLGNHVFQQSQLRHKVWHGKPIGQLPVSYTHL